MTSPTVASDRRDRGRRASDPRSGEPPGSRTTVRIVRPGRISKWTRYVPTPGARQWRRTAAAWCRFRWRRPGRRACRGRERRRPPIPAWPRDGQVRLERQRHPARPRVVRSQRCRSCSRRGRLLRERRGQRGVDRPPASIRTFDFGGVTSPRAGTRNRFTRETRRCWPRRHRGGAGREAHDVCPGPDPRCARAPCRCVTRRR